MIERKDHADIRIGDAVVSDTSGRRFIVVETADNGIGVDIEPPGSPSDFVGKYFAGKYWRHIFQFGTTARRVDPNGPWTENKPRTFICPNMCCALSHSRPTLTVLDHCWACNTRLED